MKVATGTQMKEIDRLCGDSGAKKYGQYSLMATELIEEISCVIKNVL